MSISFWKRWIKIHILLVQAAQVWEHERCDADVFTAHVKCTTISCHDKTIETRYKVLSRRDAEWWWKTTYISANFRSTTLQRDNFAPSLYMLNHCKNIAFRFGYRPKLTLKSHTLQTYCIPQSIFDYENNIGMHKERSTKHTCTYSLYGRSNMIV